MADDEGKWGPRIERVEYDDEVFKIYVEEVRLHDKSADFVMFGPDRLSWIPWLHFHPTSQVKPRGDTPGQRGHGWLVVSREFAERREWPHDVRTGHPIGYPQIQWDKGTDYKKQCEARGERYVVSARVIRKSFDTGKPFGDESDVELPEEVVYLEPLTYKRIVKWLRRIDARMRSYIERSRPDLTEAQLELLRQLLDVLDRIIEHEASEA